LARCLSEARHDKAVGPPDDKRWLVGRVGAQAAFDPSRLHQHRQPAPISGPEFLRKDEKGVRHCLLVLVQQPELIAIEVRLSGPREMNVETQCIRGEHVGLRRDADPHLSFDRGVFM
jgi:hypothetical protein